MSFHYKEAQLLHKINQGINLELRAQYQTLPAKPEAETLTDAEYNTLIQLSNQIEQFGVERLEALANLAQLRQVSLSDLMETLGIQPVTYLSASMFLQHSNNWFLSASVVCVNIAAVKQNMRSL
ncbi:hypothetical protein G7B40_005455 [Aetokthonos hydrillicola Thurmond2011]|jgi:hypothetical protein|uniref:Uncharacterized protein n=1 Tax=Aetokthonos hydrillicola Thurmond2011 TaxID=2712845 RepID=A0AAP5M8V8_9CYAN|nr:hypothetical protein [Aetokthonos hydrillicola]MBO3457309.1 hypothetical protein [Aetokthonos hydrillicola CCALA 1050]MBW4586655.1 hypothetical protein [Aetokthonos hydrillicola CCALA 1050]MDR9894018.1 hypothetical protein [Aetokthonos hydrillicola Thurmond2011]